MKMIEDPSWKNDDTKLNSYADFLGLNKRGMRKKMRKTRNRKEQSQIVQEEE